MRVLMVSDVYFPRVNGVSTSIETFRRGLVEHGITVDLCVPRYGDEPDTSGITRIPSWRIPFDPEDRLVNWRAQARQLALSVSDYDLVHIQTPFAAHYTAHQAARRAGVPVIATYHTLFEEYLEFYAPFLPAAWLKKQARKLSAKQCNDLDRVIVPSSALRDRLAAYGVTCPMTILPTGIPVERFQGGDGVEFRLRHGILSTRPIALYVGRVAHEKNIGFLLEAIAHARLKRPDILLVIAGEGPALEDLKVETQRRHLSNHVQFIGYLDRSLELPGCYAAADAFVFSSRTETQGLVLLEAMAAGKPVVALSAMGTTDILGAGRGCISPQDNPLCFGNALADLINRPGFSADLANDAVIYANEWSDKIMAAKLAELYRSITRHLEPAATISTRDIKPSPSSCASH